MSAPNFVNRGSVNRGELTKPPQILLLERRGVVMKHGIRQELWR
jgi:hypothetical protein